MNKRKIVKILDGYNILYAENKNCFEIYFTCEEDRQDFLTDLLIKTNYKCEIELVDDFGILIKK